MSIEKGLIGSEDINFGTDTFDRKSSAGTPISITKVNASHLPISDADGKFTSTDVEGALSECLVEDGIGSNSKNYTNKSGAQRVLGDVVVVDTSNDDAFTTTTTEGHTSVLGVVVETIAINASGKVVTGGYITTITVDAATSRGSFLKTSTTAGKATPSSSFVKGCFAIAMSSSAGPGSVSAVIFGSLGGDFLPLAGGLMTGMLRGAKGADVASGSTLTLGTDGNYFDVTGTTTITGIATVGVGTTVCLQFDGAVTLTHHATDLILPGAVNLTTSIGTHVWLNEYATAKWRVLGWLDPTPTGTGSQVLATSPTLTTPIFETSCSVDTINEKTATNGVTIDGLNLKDGKLNTIGCIVPSNFLAQSAGDMLVSTNTTERTTSSTSDVKLKETTWNLTTSTLRITFELKSSTGNAVYGTIYKNGSIVGTLQSTTSMSYVTFTEDIAGFTVGDLVQVYVRRGASAADAYIKNLNIYTLFPEFGTSNGSY